MQSCLLPLDNRPVGDSPHLMKTEDFKRAPSTLVRAEFNLAWLGSHSNLVCPGHCQQKLILHVHMLGGMRLDATNL